MKKVYQSPTLKVVEFKVERGFLGSFQGNQSLTDPALMEFQMEFDANDGPRNEQYTFGSENFWNN